MHVETKNYQFIEDENNLGLFKMYCEVGRETVTSERVLSLEEWSKSLSAPFLFVKTRAITVFSQIAKRAGVSYEVVTHANQLKSGDKVLELDGGIGEVCLSFPTYGNDKVSLGIDGFEDTERDYTTSIDKIVKIVPQD